jgi:hypothetical protein
LRGQHGGNASGFPQGLLNRVVGMRDLEQVFSKAGEVAISPEIPSGSAGAKLP